MSTLFLFNPTNEMAIADGGNGFVPSRYLAAFERDLEILPFLFANSDDIILVTVKPDAEWSKDLISENRNMPRFMNKEELTAALKDKSVIISNICPWGWSPRTLKVVENYLKLSTEIEPTKPNYSWSPMHKEVYGRATALETLKNIKATFEKPDLLIENNLFPYKTKNIVEIQEQLWQKKPLIIKTPHSSSGRGILMLKESSLNRSNRDWIQRAISQSGYVMVEPMLDIVAEFSMQFSINSHSYNYIAFGAFKTNSKGRYEGNFVGGFEASPEVVTFLKKLEIQRLAKITAEALKKQGIGNFYHGFLGVDMLLCRNNNGNLFMHPCSEINTRMNMGLVAHYLSKWLSAKTIGLFRIIRTSDYTGSTFNQMLEPNHPQWENQLLTKGILPITPTSNRQHVAVLEAYEKQITDNVLWFNHFRE